MQNINSDQLRRQLDENNAAMNTLADNNQKIVELLAQRGLKAIEKTADEELVFVADKIILTNTDGAEVFNTEWLNPFVSPDLPSPVINPESNRKIALTADELKTGGWWCDDTSKYCRLTFLNKDISVFSSQSWDGRYSFCFMHNDRVYRGLSRDRSRVTCSKKQIHRIGGDFYWGAP